MSVLQFRAGNKSRVERARLAVRLLQATDLSRTKEDKQIDPYAVVSCEGQSYTSKAVMKVYRIHMWRYWLVRGLGLPNALSYGTAH